MGILDGKVILVVDDEPEIREITMLEFETHGCEIDEAEKGQNEKLRHCH